MEDFAPTSPSYQPQSDAMEYDQPPSPCLSVEVNTTENMIQLNSDYVASDDSNAEEMDVSQDEGEEGEDDEASVNNTSHDKSFRSRFQSGDSGLTSRSGVQAEYEKEVLSLQSEIVRLRADRDLLNTDFQTLDAAVTAKIAEKTELDNWLATEGKKARELQRLAAQCRNLEAKIVATRATRKELSDRYDRRQEQIKIGRDLEIECERLTQLSNVSKVEVDRLEQEKKTREKLLAELPLHINALVAKQNEMLASQRRVEAHVGSRNAVAMALKRALEKIAESVKVEDSDNPSNVLQTLTFRLDDDGITILTEDVQLYHFRHNAVSKSQYEFLAENDKIPSFPRDAILTEERASQLLVASGLTRQIEQIVGHQTGNALRLTLAKAGNIEQNVRDCLTIADRIRQEGGQLQLGSLSPIIPVSVNSSSATSKHQTTPATPFAMDQTMPVDPMIATPAPPAQLPAADGRRKPTTPRMMSGGRSANTTLKEIAALNISIPAVRKVKPAPSTAGAPTSMELSQAGPSSGVTARMPETSQVGPSSTRTPRTPEMSEAGPSSSGAQRTPASSSSSTSSREHRSSGSSHDTSTRRSVKELNVEESLEAQAQAQERTKRPAGRTSQSRRERSPNDDRVSKRKSNADSTSTNDRDAASSSSGTRSKNRVPGGGFGGNTFAHPSAIAVVAPSHRSRSRHSSDESVVEVPVSSVRLSSVVVVPTKRGGAKVPVISSTLKAFAFPRVNADATRMPPVTSDRPVVLVITGTHSGVVSMAKPEFLRVVRLGPSPGEWVPAPSNVFIHERSYFFEKFPVEVRQVSISKLNLGYGESEYYLPSLTGAICHLAGLKSRDNLYCVLVQCGMIDCIEAAKTSNLDAENVIPFEWFLSQLRKSLGITMGSFGCPLIYLGTEHCRLPHGMILHRRSSQLEWNRPDPLDADFAMCVQAACEDSYLLLCSSLGQTMEPYPRYYVNFLAVQRVPNPGFSTGAATQLIHSSASCVARGIFNSFVRWRNHYCGRSDHHAICCGRPTVIAEDVVLPPIHPYDAHVHEGDEDGLSPCVVWLHYHAEKNREEAAFNFPGQIQLKPSRKLTAWYGNLPANFENPFLDPTPEEEYLKELRVGGNNWPDNWKERMADFRRENCKCSEAIRANGCQCDFAE